MTGGPVAAGAEVVLTADPGQVGVGGPPPGVHLLTVTTNGHLDLLRGVHARERVDVPAGGGAVLAVRGGVAVAAAAWTAVEHGTSELVGVVTVAAQRRCGIGALVVGAAAAAAARAGADLVWLRTHDVGALRLYQALGFEPTDALDGPAAPDLP